MPVPPVKAECPNHVWTYDFMFDSLSNGNRLKLLTVEDEYTREGLAIHVDRRIKSNDLICILDDLFHRYGNPAFIRSDNGPEFIAEKLKNVDQTTGHGYVAHRRGQPLAERFHREFQLQGSRRASEHGDFLHASRSAGKNGDVA